MKIHELTTTTSKDRKRVGRGIGSGYGKTAGRGTKGQNARTGGGVRPGFEGGQNPLLKRLPKLRGFVPVARRNYQPVNLADLNAFADSTTVDVAALVKSGAVKDASRPVKLLGGGTLERKLTVKVQAASRAAQSAVEAKGGMLELLAATKVESKQPKAKA